MASRPEQATLRNPAVTWLKQAGLPSFEVAGFVGMSERMVEEVYGKHDPDFQRETARRIGYRRPWNIAFPPYRWRFVGPKWPYRGWT